MRKTDAVPDWKRNKKPIYVWIREETKSKLKTAAKERELPMRKLISEILERALTQL